MRIGWIEQHRAARLGAVVLAMAASLCAASASAQSADRPNILWLSSEDNGPHLGAYGDAQATTPALDALAARGMRFRRAWSNAPVCAPSRTAIITGVSPTSTGGMHMRSEVPLPASIRMFPQLLREQGYYTSNNSKEDYNHPLTGQVWDESSPRAHWRGRGNGQPFFAVFNITTTHESQIRKRPHTPVHDPARVRIPAYQPDAPEIRQDWAQYYDKMTEMDREVAERLRELDEAGLADSTIIVYWGDHGIGLPRGKRWLYTEGLSVPLIVYVPERFRMLAPEGYAAGAASDRLVTLMDLAPSMLSVAGLPVPAWMQGRAFMGPARQPAPRYIYAFRDRMDERYDLSRAVRDDRYLYIRNYLPHRPQGQYLAYMFETPTTQVWKARFDAGTLTPEQSTFWQPKAPEELYDLQADPDNVRNLVDAPAVRAEHERLRGALHAHLLETRDLGFLHEGDMHRRRGAQSPYELGRDEARYPLPRILAMADRASLRLPANAEALRAGLADADPAVRYWAATGFLVLGKDATQASTSALLARLDDSAPAPRVVAAEALARWGDQQARTRALDTLVATADLRRDGNHAAIMALNALESLERITDPVRARLAGLPEAGDDVPTRERDYVTRLKQATVEPADSQPQKD